MMHTQIYFNGKGSLWGRVSTSLRYKVFSPNVTPISREIVGLSSQHNNSLVIHINGKGIKPEGENVIPHTNILATQLKLWGVREIRLHNPSVEGLDRILNVLFKTSIRLNNGLMKNDFKVHTPKIDQLALFLDYAPSPISDPLLRSRSL
jgi:hypothetical protein